MPPLRALRVWMINRPDSFQSVGGDTIQMQKTAEALTAFGIRTEVHLSDQLPAGEWDCDLVHIFNLQTPETSWEACQQAEKRNLPIIVSPIFWDPLPEWFEYAPQKKVLWKLVRSTLGQSLGFKIYAVWQRTKFPSQDRWQLQRGILQSATGILPNSIAEQHQLMSIFRLPSRDREKFQVVPNAIDPALFAKIPQANPALKRQLNNHRAVIQVARLSPEKNQLALLRALWDVPVDLILVGSASASHPGYAADLRRQAAVRGNVHFLDWTDQRNLPGIYAVAEVHALPSFRETPGLATLEAAAAGCRVVSTSVGSAREYLGDEAWYCRPDRQESIRRAVLCALESPAQPTLRNRILSDYNWEAAARATVKAYQASLPAGKVRDAQPHGDRQERLGERPANADRRAQVLK